MPYNQDFLNSGYHSSSPDRPPTFEADIDNTIFELLDKFPSKRFTTREITDHCAQTFPKMRRNLILTKLDAMHEDDLVNKMKIGRQCCWWSVE